MVNLGELEGRLKADPAYRKQFMADPVGELRKLGVVLSAEQAQYLRDSVSGRVNATPGRPRHGIIAVLIGL